MDDIERERKVLAEKVESLEREIENVGLISLDQLVEKLKEKEKEKTPEKPA
jgi:hypothetical protein